MKKLRLLPATGILAWMIGTTIVDREQNKRLDALEHQYGVRINGMDYQIFPVMTNWPAVKE